MCPIGGKPAGGDDEMDVRVKQQGARPRVQGRDAAEWSADEPGVGGERLERRRRTPHQCAIDDGLVTDGERAQRHRQRDGDQIVATGQQPRAVPLEPARGLVPPTLRTMPVAARVIPIHLPATRGALRELPAARRRPTRREVAQCARLAREQTRPEIRAHGGPMAADDLRHLEHDSLCAAIRGPASVG